jgi:sulfotransferase family protein
VNQLFIVGAQRSGSTYLYQMLDAHPEVLMAKPIRPEPKFFLDQSNILKGRDEYEKIYFSELNEMHKYIGEKSTSYIESSVVAKHIKGFYPEAKILIILRNPATRAYSNYKFSVSNNIETNTFKDALRLEATRLEQAPKHSSSVNPFAYYERGLYSKYISKYLNMFSSEQVKVIIFEEFVSNQNAISELYEYLAVDSTFLPESLGGKVNSSATNSFDESGGFEEVRLELLARYENSIRALESLLGKSLDVWREF